jgi:hypothetical protein
MKWIPSAVALVLAIVASWWLVVLRRRNRRESSVPSPPVKPFTQGPFSRRDFTTEGGSDAEQGMEPDVCKMTNRSNATMSFNAADMAASQAPHVKERTQSAAEPQGEPVATKKYDANQSDAAREPQPSEVETNPFTVSTDRTEEPFAIPLSASPPQPVEGVGTIQSAVALVELTEDRQGRGTTNTAGPTQAILQTNPLPTDHVKTRVRHPRSMLTVVAHDDSQETEPTASASVPPAHERPVVEEESGEAVAEHGAQTPRYRAPSSNPPRTRAPRTQPPQTQSDPSNRNLEVRIHAQMDRRGHFQFGLLMERPPNSPEKLGVTLERCHAELQAHGDDWYETPRPTDIGTLLADGFTIRSRSKVNQPVRWALSAGRPFYILAPQQGLRGFVSIARLRLGCPQVVICLPEWHDRVYGALAEACSSVIESAPNTQGVPDGWTFFTPITPCWPVPPKQGEDLLNLLRPLPDIEIILDGGLWLRASVWLAAYPPIIRLTGELPEGRELLVDNVVATQGADHAFTAPGYDAPGTHVVWCDGRSVTYTIANPPAEWLPWDSHPRCRGSVCGAIAQIKNGDGERLFTTPMSNPVLVGAEPGQIFVCSHRSAPIWAGLVPFDPVWAIPADPLHCDKRDACVQLCKAIPLLRTPGQTLSRAKGAHIDAWCTAILNSRRKALRIQPDESRELWNVYLKEARRLWRTRR